MPSNDEDNIRWIWEKCIKDCLTHLRVWPDDNMYWCRGTNSTVYFCETLEDRKIEITLIEL
jgi:Holliday junction resolvase RusA-like endonuclease